MNTIDLCRGAFQATFEKGKKGKPGKWTMTTILSKIGKKPEAKKESLKEKPQYAVIEEFEAAAKTRYQKNLSKGVLEITKYLKSL